MTAPDLTFVVMVKHPVAGRVKTRLVEGGLLSAHGAADLAWAMLECTVTRLAARGEVIVAVAADGAEGAAGDAIRARTGLPDLTVVPQGPGDLGDRLGRVWRGLGAGSVRGVAFFGIDSPDVPAEALEEIGPGLARADLAVGPTEDGGYWTLAARSYRPEVLRCIDWGGESVYDQTCLRAGEAGLRLRRLPRWYDVDRPEDVGALRRRLRRPPARTHASPGEDALAELSRRIDELLRDRI